MHPGEDSFLLGRMGLMLAPPLRRRGLLGGGERTGLDSSSSLLLEDSACNDKVFECNVFRTIFHDLRVIDKKVHAVHIFGEKVGESYKLNFGIF